MSDYNCKLCNRVIEEEKAYEVNYCCGRGLNRLWDGKDNQHIFTSKTIDMFCVDCVKYLEKIYIETGKSRAPGSRDGFFETSFSQIFSNQKIIDCKSNEPFCIRCEQVIYDNYYAVLFEKYFYSGNSVNTEDVYFLHAFCELCHKKMLNSEHAYPYVQYLYSDNQHKVGYDRSIMYPFSLNYISYEKLYDVE